MGVVEVGGSWIGGQMMGMRVVEVDNDFMMMKIVMTTIIRNNLS
jgi:hypothetical protein